MTTKPAAPAEKKPVPVIANLLRLTNPKGTEGVLPGTKCKDCGVVFFGSREFCANCTSGNMQPIELSKQGKVSTWTIVRVPPGGWKGAVPYALAQVSLPEGPDVTAEMVDLPLEKLEP